MDPYAPINGISLERYAELAADVSEISDPAQQAETVGRKGVSPVDWEAAKSGWTARMQDMSLMGQVASRFMPLYQAALARKSPAPQVGYEDYVAMCGCPPVMGIEGMLAHYKLTMAQWTQIAGHWNAVIPTSPMYMQHGMLVEQEAARLRAGGAPRPVSLGGAASGGHVPAAAPSAGHAVSGAMPGAVPPPGYGTAPAYAAPAYAAPYAPAATPGYAAPQLGQPLPAGHGPQPGYLQPGYPQPGYPLPAYSQPAYPLPGHPLPGHPLPGPAQPGYPQPGYPQPPGYNQQAAAFGNEVGSAFNAFGNALGSFVGGAVAGFTVGMQVLVQWSDGRRYPATVMAAQGGQVQVHFPDGRQVWVPQTVVTSR